jgi:8-oxo-dGTP pyrophosphatase MutT (NUDIX family)
MSASLPSDPRPDDPRPWEVLERTYLLRKPPWLTLRQDHVRLANGQVIAEYFVNEYPDWINVVAVTEARQIVLVRQYRHGLGRVDYELPGGVADDTDASPEASARRELLEETGYGGGDWRPFMVLSPNPALQSNLVHTFLATGVRLLHPPRPEATEELSVHLLDAAAARRAVFGGEVIQALHAAPLLRYFLETGAGTD